LKASHPGSDLLLRLVVSHSKQRLRRLRFVLVHVLVQRQLVPQASKVPHDVVTARERHRSELHRPRRRSSALGFAVLVRIVARSLFRRRRLRGRRRRGIRRRRVRGSHGSVRDGCGSVFSRGGVHRGGVRVGHRERRRRRGVWGRGAGGAPVWSTESHRANELSERESARESARDDARMVLWERRVNEKCIWGDVWYRALVHDAVARDGETAGVSRFETVRRRTSARDPRVRERRRAGRQRWRRCLRLVSDPVRDRCTCAWR